MFGGRVEFGARQQPVCGRMRRIEDYAIIGDCRSAALVNRSGSIDWLCWPQFDADACFAALLGTARHGRWLIDPCAPARITRRYRDDTLILETSFETDEGAVTVIDFMPGNDSHPELVRLVRGERGAVAMRTELVLRFGYGTTVPWVTRQDDGTLRAIAGPDMVLLRTPVRLYGKDLTTLGEFTVKAGDTIPFTLTYGRSFHSLPPPRDPQTMLATTEKFWRDWTAKCRIGGPWTAQVKRSLMTLKALTFAETGGIVAAATTSLPEQIGGVRNWDYRYCWVRDATLTLLALLNAGYFQEAHDWREWLVRAAAGTPADLQIMYSVTGRRRLTEWQVPWLPGYEQSQPVRIGNAAHSQIQLDVYGEIMDTLHHARLNGLEASASGWDLQKAVLTRLENIWREPDSGIWEVRGTPRHFIHSKVMAWVAFDRAIATARQFKLDGPVRRWMEIRAAIHADVCEHGVDAQGAFVRAYGTTGMDASLLQLPAVGFLPAGDPRIAATVRRIEETLLVDGLVRRYDTAQGDDGLDGGEGVFIACSFWLVDVYVLMGRLEQAHRLFERLLSLCNDVGLLSEEYDPKARRQLGNFPQALSHIALVNSAFNLSQPRKPAHQRAMMRT